MMTALKAIRRVLLTEHYVGTRRPTPRQRRRRQRGVALIAVIIALGITMLIASDLGTSTTVDLVAAANYRDTMRAQFLARSSLDLAELVIRLQERMDNIKQLRGQVQITDFADQVELAFCGSAEEVQAAVGFSPSAVKGLGADIGTCGILGSITTDDDKLNVNCANGNDATAGALKSELDALFYFPAYDWIFDEPSADNYRRDRPTQEAAIMDYIDNNLMINRDRGTSEDYGYEALKDRYFAKNTYIDTLGEMKLIRGVDDRFWTLFGHAFTVYGSCKVNLSTLDNVQLIAAMLFLSAKNPTDPVLSNQMILFQLADLVSKAKLYGETFQSINDFVSFVADPQASIGSLATQSGTLAGSAAGAALAQGIPGLASGKIGLALDPNKLGQIATTGPRRTYRVHAWGEIPRAQTSSDGSPIFPPIRATLEGVWDTKVVPQNVRHPPMPNGAWVFMKEEE
jgi:general secretion pathway protein K